MTEPIEIVSHGLISGQLLPTGSSASAPGDVSGMTTPAGPATPWRPGLATGLGSLPGTDPGEAAALVAGELPDLPHLPELPDRGPAADMIGRALAICVDMPAELAPFGWRLTRRAGSDLRRARDFLAWDADAAEQRFAGAPWLKVQVAGPWTLAATVETPRCNRVLTDPGALRDLTDSLTEGLAQWLADLGRRLPGTRFLVQLDEPSLPAVLAGSLPTASGFARVAAVPGPEAQALLAPVVASLDDHETVAHCCHPDAPIALLRGAGFGALSVDLSAGQALPTQRLDQLGEVVEAGAVLLAGLVPTREPAGRAGEGLDFHAVAAPLLDLWHRIGLPASRLDQVVVTPTCGLAGAPQDWVRRALALSRDAAKLLADRAGA